MGRGQGLVARLEGIAAGVALPSDSEEERLRKAVLVVFPALVSTMAVVWVVTYWVLGLRLAALVPLGYQIVSVPGLFVFLRTRRFRLFRLSQVGLMLVLPPLLQWALGGFVTSSAVVIWAFMAPLGALLFRGRREAIPWFVGFLGVVVLSGIFEVAAPRAVAIPSRVVVTFFTLNVVGVGVATFLMLQYFVRARDRAHRALAAEREKSERLLLNVLPEPVARRLKEEEEGVIAEAHADVSVLFADIVDFTPLAERLTPEEVVALLDRVFTIFDGLADRWGLEKIKTIGDAYMVAGGLPEPLPDHPAALAEMALAMRGEVGGCAAEFGIELAVRIGMEVGPVVAGVIGRRKFIYDLWGDTVNTASRMESHGLPGVIQVGPAAHRRLQDRYLFEPRGPLEVKGKGLMDPYLLVGRR